MVIHVTHRRNACFGVKCLATAPKKQMKKGDLPKNIGEQGDSVLDHA